jgi:hypothetical protein
MSDKKAAKLKISKADAVTTSARIQVRRVATKLLADNRINALGVYMDPRGVADALLDASQELERVRQMILSAQWPTDADYDAGS